MNIVCAVRVFLYNCFCLLGGASTPKHHAPRPRWLVRDDSGRLPDRKDDEDLFTKSVRVRRIV